MKSLAFAIAALAAGCASDSGDDYPIQPQVTHPAGGTTSAVTGRVCVAGDLRTLGTCSSSAAGGLAVALDGTTTTTAADGTFTLPAPTSAGAMFTVSGTSTAGVSLVPTSAVFSPTAVIPAVDQELFQTLLDTNGVTVDSGTGSILGVVQSNGAGATGVTVSSVPNGAGGPFYAASSPSVWSGTGTGTSGAFLIPGLTAGSVDLSYQTVLGGEETTINGVQVRAGGVTVLDTALPGTIQ